MTPGRRPAEGMDPMKKKQPPVTTLDADGQPRRKLGEEHEDLTVHLTEDQISDERARVCSLMQEVEKLDAEVKSATAGTRARIKELKAKIAASVAAAQTLRHVSQEDSPSSRLIGPRSGSAEIHRTAAGVCSSSGIRSAAVD